MTDDHYLAEIQQRVEQATKGPWRHETHEGGQFGERTYSSGHVVADAHTYAGNSSPRTRRESVTSPDTMTFADGEFIAHARIDLPYLLERVQELQKENDDLRARVVERGELVTVVPQPPT